MGAPAVNLQEVMELKISAENIIVGGGIIFLFILFKDVFSALSKRLTDRIFGRGDKGLTTDTVTTTHQEPSPGGGQCGVHPQIMDEIKFVRRHIAWSGKMIFLIAQKLELRNLPEEPEE